MGYMIRKNKIGLNGKKLNQHIEKLHKEISSGFNQIWKVIALMQENRATKFEVSKAILISVGISALMNIAIILFIKL